jgi:hypothetical protein
MSCYLFPASGGGIVFETLGARTSPGGRCDARPWGDVTPVTAIFAGPRHHGVSYRLSGPVALVSRRRNRAKALTLGPANQAVHDLSLDQVAQKGYVLRCIKKIQ